MLWVIALNSASALLILTTLCFLLLKVTRFPHTWVQYPEVDFLSTTNLAQSASLKIAIFLSLIFLKYRHFPGLAFKYPRILQTAQEECINKLITLTGKAMWPDMRQVDQLANQYLVSSSINGNTPWDPWGVRWPATTHFSFLQEVQNLFSLGHNNPLP